MGFSGRRLGSSRRSVPLIGVMLAVRPWRPLFLLHGLVAGAGAGVWLPAGGGRGPYPLATRPRFQPLRGRAQEVARQVLPPSGGASVSAAGATGSGSGATATGSGSAATTGSEIASVSAGGARSFHDGCCRCGGAFDFLLLHAEAEAAQDAFKFFAGAADERHHVGHDGKAAAFNGTGGAHFIGEARRARTPVRARDRPGAPACRCAPRGCRKCGSRRRRKSRAALSGRRPPR